jgi:hypothetical protein
MSFPAFYKREKKKLLLCLFNSFFLVIVSFSWINYSYIITDDEESLIKATTGLKDIFFDLKKKPSPDSFLFINLSWEKQLIEVRDEYGQKIGNRAITNRQRIANFFELLNKKPQHRFIILDVWFKDSSDRYSDSLLQAQLKQTKNILIPYHKSDQDDNVKDLPIFDVPVALSDYEKDDFENNFIKFRLVQGDNFKTTPLVLYETLHGKEFTSSGIFNYLNDKISLNSFILNLRIWSRDLEELENEEKISSTYIKMQLSQFLDPEIDGTDSLPEEMAQSINKNFRAEMVNMMCKDRIVVMGDFEDSDIHQTIYGPTPGPLILLNVYLALKEGDSLVSIIWILFLFVGYFLISYRCFAKADPIDIYILSRFLPPTPFRTFILSFVGYMIYFGILSVASYFLFNVHLTILFLAIYMEILDLVIEALESRKQGFVEKST